MAKREQFAISLRKQKKSELLRQKRKKIAEKLDLAFVNGGGHLPSEDSKLSPQYRKPPMFRHSYGMEQYQNLITQIVNGDGQVYDDLNALEPLM